VKHVQPPYYPEINVLIPVRSVAEKRSQPVSKSVRISLKPSMPQPIDQGVIKLSKIWRASMI